MTRSDRAGDGAGPESSIEPLFAHQARVWIRVWAAAQAAAIAIGGYVALRPGDASLPPDRPTNASRLAVVLVLLVVYHVVGVGAHRWLLRRHWAVALFVPLGWVLVLFALEANGAFGLLLLGAVLQGFIFLPFAWAAALLALATAGMATLVGANGRGHRADVVAARVGVVLATGVVIGTVLLYIHRANQEAALRARLLRQLDAARRDLAARAREAGVRDERQRFARDVHDTLAQGFASVIKHLEASEIALGGPTDARERAAVLRHLAYARAASQASLDEIRTLVWALRPAPLTDAPLAQALTRVVAQWGEANGTRATFSSDALPALHPDADVVLLRATQESLSNVARHARAGQVDVSLACVEGLVLLTVEDDGCGFAYPDAPDPAHAAGRGLAGMRERVRAFGGHVIVNSAVGTGTSVTVAVPLAAAAATGRAGRARA